MFDRMMSGLTALGFVGFVLLLGWLIFAPADISGAGSLGSKLGSFIEGVVYSRTDADEAYEQRLAEAVAEVERVNQAYTNLFGAYANAVNTAYAMESRLFDRQAETISSTHFVGKIGANVADLVCMMYGASPSAQIDPSLRHYGQNACQSEENIREGLVKDYAVLLTKHRSTLPKDMIAGIPLPDQLLSDEFKASSKRYQVSSDDSGS